MSVKGCTILKILLLFAVLICLSGCKSAYEYGNMTGNRYTAKQNGWVYYSDNNFRLYKMKEDGSEKTRLSDGFCTDINISGKWLYYVKGLEYGKLPDDMLEELCKIKIDGTNEQILYHGTSITPVKVVNNEIYFSDCTDEAEPSRYLYKIDIDGKNKIRIGKDKIVFFDVSKDWIYYTNKDNHICKISVDGSNQMDLSTVDSGNLLVADDWIYYIEDFNKMTCINNVYKNPSKLCRIKIDGANRKLLRENVWDFNIIGKKIYFHDLMNDNFYSMESTGTNSKFIINGAMMYFDALGDWIYYRSTKIENAYQLRRMKLNGTENHILK